MKNSLDEIECTPTLGGLEPPYSVTSHPYCIDIITTYFSISKLEFQNKSEALQNIKENIEYYCYSNKIHFTYHFENKLPLIIAPETNNFQWFFGLQLITFDTYRIPSLLSFQKKRYINEEIDFVTFIEFAVYPIVKNFPQSHNFNYPAIAARDTIDDKLKMIMNWVVDERKAESYSEYLTNLKNQPSDNTEKAVNSGGTNNDMDETIRTRKDPRRKIGNAKLKKSSVSFEFNKWPHANSLMEAFKLLKGGGFIRNDSGFEFFKSIFSGQKILREQRIIWTGKKMDLKEFILLLIREEVIKSAKYKWEIACDCFMSEIGDFEPLSLTKAKGKNIETAKLKTIVSHLK